MQNTLPIMFKTKNKKTEKLIILLNSGIVFPPIEIYTKTKVSSFLVSVKMNEDHSQKYIIPFYECGKNQQITI